MKCIALQQYCKSMMSLHCTGWRHFVGASTISFRPFSAFGHVSVSLSVLSVCLHWTSLDTLGIWPQGLDGRIIPRALRLLRSRCKLPSFVKPSNRVKPLFELVSLRVTTCHSLRLGSWWFQSMSQTCCASSSKMAHNIAKSLNVTLSCNDLGIQVKFSKVPVKKRPHGQGYGCYGSPRDKLRHCQQHLSSVTVLLLDPTLWCVRVIN